MNCCYWALKPNVRLSDPSSDERKKRDLVETPHVRLSDLLFPPGHRRSAQPNNKQATTEIMIPLYHTPALLSFARKIFSPENAALLFLAAPGSMSLTGLLDILVDDTPLKALILPLLVAAVCLSLYFVVFMLDFVSGVKASRHEAVDKQDYFSSAKGWSSIWKIATVSILVIWSSFFSMLAALAGMPYLPGFFMITAATIAIMASLLDVYSIGENQKRLTGKKARIFEWLEQLRNSINKGLLERIGRWFSPP